MHPSVQNVLQWFRFDHLNGDLREVSKQFHDLAIDLTAKMPEGTEVTVGLRKLLEAKDCFVRAAISAGPLKG